MKTNKSLKQLLYEYYNIKITKHHYTLIQRYVAEFETRSSHIDALNTSLLGVSKMYFLPKDQQALFNIFDIDIGQFKKVVHSAAGVDTSRIVTSDPFNILIIWLAHQAYQSSLSSKEKSSLQVFLFQILHYKFFTSIVNHQLPHGADESVMQFTINNLSGKFYIKQKDTSTWREAIEARSKDVVSESSIHHGTIQSFHPDKQVLYVISDIQTRLRKQLGIIIQEFYKNKEEGHRIVSTLMTDEIDGVKSIRAVSSLLDTVVERVSNSALNLNEFIDHEMIQVAVALTKNIKVDTMNALLIRFSELAVTQQQKGDQDKVQGSGSHRILIGYRTLIQHVIQKTYRICMLDKDVNIRSKVSILEKTQIIYRSSRISDTDILMIKNSVDAFVNKYSNSSRSATNASLKIAFLTYLMLLSFKGM